MTRCLTLPSLEDRLAVSEEGSNGSPLHNLVLHHFHHLHHLQCHLWSNLLHRLRRGVHHLLHHLLLTTPLLLPNATQLSGALMRRSSQHLVRQWLIVEKFLLSVQQPVCLSTTTCHPRLLHKACSIQAEGKPYLGNLTATASAALGKLLTILNQVLPVSRTAAASLVLHSALCSQHHTISLHQLHCIRTRLNSYSTK